MIQPLLRLPSRIEGFQDADQSVPVLQFLEIVSEIEPGHIDPVLFEKLGFEFAVRACADEPKGHDRGGLGIDGDGERVGSGNKGFEPAYESILEHYFIGMQVQALKHIPLTFH